ncbi:MAG: hypothetical protein ACREGD_02095 [Candidatus Saccharimonadales bacterium]
MPSKKTKFEWSIQKVLAVVAIVLLAGVFIYAVVAITANKQDVGTPPSSGQQLTVEGEYVCLPKAGSGPQTLECAFGIQTTDDVYYGLDFTQVGGDAAVSALRIGDRVRITGTFEPQESIYISEGVVRVLSFEEL